MSGMARKSPDLLSEIEAFLAESAMGASYFGKKSVGNSELVPRLRAGRRVWPETDARVRSFLKVARAEIRASGHVGLIGQHQGQSHKKTGAA